MKIEFQIVKTDGTKRKSVGNRHYIKLSNGETITVATNKVYPESNDYYWNVTDIESGMALAGYYDYYSVFRMHGEVDTEKNALETAKNRVEFYIKKKRKTFAKIRKERMEKEK